MPHAAYWSELEDGEAALRHLADLAKDPKDDRIAELDAARKRWMRVADERALQVATASVMMRSAKSALASAIDAAVRKGDTVDWDALVQQLVAAHDALPNVE